MHIKGATPCRTRLPNKLRAQAIERKRTNDRFARTALAVGFFGLFFSVMLMLTGGDRYIAIYVMFVTAAIALLMLRWDGGPPARE